MFLLGVCAQGWQTPLDALLIHRLSSSSTLRGGAVASIHDFEMETITGESQSLSQYNGQVCLIVNVATE